MEYKDYYKTLGVNKTASADEIKKAYRKLARKHHPDVNPNDKTAESKFKELQEAYDILKDEKKRKEYDELGTNYFNFKNAGGGGPSQGRYNYDYSGGGPSGFNYNAAGGGAGFNFEDIFSDLFNRSGRNQGPMKGNDLNSSLEISVVESVKGTERIFNINGEKIKVKIPAGISNGGKIKISGKGSPGFNGGPNGDLYITISVLNDNIFERKDNDIYINKKNKINRSCSWSKSRSFGHKRKFYADNPRRNPEWNKISNS